MSRFERFLAVGAVVLMILLILATAQAHAEPQVTDEQGNEVEIVDVITGECPNEVVQYLKARNVPLDAGLLVEVGTDGPVVYYCEVE